MATKGYNLEQTGEQVQEALNKVINLAPATVDTAGLMSAADKEKLNSLPTGATLESSLGAKVDKVTGKGLSTNDYDNSEKSKVASAYQKPGTGIPKEDLSDGVKASLGNADSASQDVADIKTKIPSQATDQNQLADKDFVNSSIATATADFKGTYDSLSELQAKVDGFDSVVVDEDGLFVVDMDLNIGVKVDEDGIHAKNILEYEIIG